MDTSNLKPITVADLIDLVQHIDSEDPIDWAMLNIDEHTATELIANNILDQYYNTWQNFNEQDRLLIMLATVTKLTLENFVLNLKLHQ